MRSLWEVSGLYICLILSRLFNAVTSVVYVENGTSLTLKPNIQGKPEEILWTHNGNKVAENDLIEFTEYGQFKGRSEIEVSTGQLMVHQMTSRDSGVYRSIIQINGKLQNSEVEVEVIDAVPEPFVICHLNNTSKALLCSVSSQSGVSYTWSGSGLSPQSGQELHLSGEETPDSVYTCTVKNEVSERSSSFSLKHCDTDGPQSDQNIILYVAIGIAIPVVIIAVAVGICLFTRRKNNDGYLPPQCNGQSVGFTSQDERMNESRRNPRQRRNRSEDGQQNGQGKTVTNKESDSDNEEEEAHEGQKLTILQQNGHEEP